MAESHNNTRPDRAGYYGLSPSGLISYFPIEKASFLKPFMALVLCEKTDGTIYAVLDTRMEPIDKNDET